MENQTVFLILAAMVGIGFGFLFGRFLLMKVFSNMEKDAIEKGKAIIKQAESKSEMIKKEKHLQIKESINKLKAECDSDINRRKNQASQNEAKLKQREQSLGQRQNDLKRKEDQLEVANEKLAARKEMLEKRNEEMEAIKSEHIEKLEKISNLSAEQASAQLIESLRTEAQTKAAGLVNEMVEEAKLTANKDAKKIIIQSIQRLATEAAVENCVSVFNIESEEVKGRIIGREGRNIRALEAATGVEIIVDDTPEAIVLSCFDPVRREVARLSLHKLVTDGRIHPARVEEVVEKTRKGIEEEIINIGERTVIDLGIHGLHPELIRLVGRMRYRASYGQNLLQHSREVAKLCAIMASELGVNSKLAKRAGLLHDIGKVYPDEPEIPHALLGKQLAEKYKEVPAICNAIGAHHDEIEMTHIISPIVQACDAISGARPGARREVVDSYIQRIKNLEELALSYPGVGKTFAIQAGRELRVMVEADRVTDTQANSLANEISLKIQTEMQYPGQIKVTVIRETRAVSIAK